MIGKDGLTYVQHCRHCGMSINYHGGTDATAKCLWSSLAFEPVQCTACDKPVLFEDSEQPLEDPSKDAEKVCGRCNPWLPA